MMSFLSLAGDLMLPNLLRAKALQCCLPCPQWVTNSILRVFRSSLLAEIQWGTGDNTHPIHSIICRITFVMNFEFKP